MEHSLDTSRSEISDKEGVYFIKTINDSSDEFESEESYVNETSTLNHNEDVYSLKLLTS